jgi:hypothetical protein
MSKYNAQLREVSYRTSQREIQPEVLLSASSYPLNFYGIYLPRKTQSNYLTFNVSKVI